VTLADSLRERGVLQPVLVHPRPGGGYELRARLPAAPPEAPEEFAAIMAALDLPRPKKIDLAVPANRRCGVVEEPVRRPGG
jgi:ParB-like chromosome segregation protein Spo0J